MGKFYARGDEDAPEAIGINLTDMTTGVHLFSWQGRPSDDDTVFHHFSLTAPEAFKLARQLQDSAEFLVMDNCGCPLELERDDDAHRKHHGFGPAGELAVAIAPGSRISAGSTGSRSTPFSRGSADYERRGAAVAAGNGPQRQRAPARPVAPLAAVLSARVLHELDARAARGPARTGAAGDLPGARGRPETS